MAELGAGGGSGYPGALDTDATPETDNVTDARADVPNDLADAIIKIETELGTDPAGASADLVTRLGDVTAAEFSQLETLGATTVSATQWGALGALVEWTDWTPNLVGGANLSGYTVARYYRIGDICFFRFTAEGKNVTTASHIQVTLPFTAAATGYDGLTCLVNDGAAWVGQVQCTIEQNTSYFRIYKTAASGDWAGTENGVYIRMNGFFEIQ